MKNLMNSDHITSNEKSRDGYDNIEWETENKCWLCNGAKIVFIPSSDGRLETECQECK